MSARRRATSTSRSDEARPRERGRRSSVAARHRSAIWIRAASSAWSGGSPSGVPAPGARPARASAAGSSAPSGTSLCASWWIAHRVERGPSTSSSSTSGRPASSAVRRRKRRPPQTVDATCTSLPSLSSSPRGSSRAALAEAGAGPPPRRGWRAAPDPLVPLVASTPAAPTPAVLEPGSAATSAGIRIRRRAGSGPVGEARRGGPRRQHEPHAVGAPVAASTPARRTHAGPRPPSAQARRVDVSDHQEGPRQPPSAVQPQAARQQCRRDRRPSQVSRSRFP